MCYFSRGCFLSKHRQTRERERREVVVNGVCEGELQVPILAKFKVISNEERGSDDVADEDEKTYDDGAKTTSLRLQDPFGK